MSGTITEGSRWVCCQLGAREHYALARALFRGGVLAGLVTDLWVPPGTVLGALPGQRFKRLSERFHPQLESARISAFNASLLKLEIEMRLGGLDGWAAIMRRNAWFQRRALEALEQIAVVADDGRGLTVLSYSYTAEKLFREARSRGYRTVLAQIDPGPLEEDLVAEAHARHPQLGSQWRRAPREYWDLWREECELADRIIVNSDWSRQALVTVGVDRDKIRVVPLIYEADGARPESARSYPRRFDAARPLRVLFLGAANLRKGVAEILEAVRLLPGAPIEVRIVGPQDLAAEARDSADARVLWEGAVPRSETHEHYERADVFLFPTLSDGFGLTQLEARSWGLPIITSRNCGRVVEHDRSGLVLDEVSARSVADALAWCLDNPRMLEGFSEAALEPDSRFTPEAVRSSLLAASGSPGGVAGEMV